jgi:hypothetical protein
VEHTRLRRGESCAWNSILSGAFPETMEWKVNFRTAVVCKTRLIAKHLTILPYSTSFGKISFHPIMGIFGKAHAEIFVLTFKNSERVGIFPKEKEGSALP